MIFDLDIQGTDVIKNAFGDQAKCHFIKPPSYEILEKRLRGN